MTVMWHAAPRQRCAMSLLKALVYCVTQDTIASKHHGYSCLCIPCAGDTAAALARMQLQLGVAGCQQRAELLLRELPIAIAVMRSERRRHHLHARLPVIRVCQQLTWLSICEEAPCASPRGMTWSGASSMPASLPCHDSQRTLNIVEGSRTEVAVLLLEAGLLGSLLCAERRATLGVQAGPTGLVFRARWGCYL